MNQTVQPNSEILLNMNVRRLRDETFVIYESIMVKTKEVQGTLKFHPIQNQKKIVTKNDVDLSIRLQCEQTGYFSEEKSLLPHELLGIVSP